jgi:hypothetical protein
MCGALVAAFAERAGVGTPWADPFCEKQTLSLKVLLKRDESRACIWCF